MATEDDTMIETIEKDVLIYKGKPIEEIQSFLLEFRQKGFTSSEFVDEIEKHGQLPIYIDLEDLIFVYDNI